MNFQTFVARGQAAQLAVEAILFMQPRFTSADLPAANVRNARRAMRTWALTFRHCNSRAASCHALFKAVQWRECAKQLATRISKLDTCSYG